jgi:carbamoyl-phosphate synthase large subunit
VIRKVRRQMPRRTDIHTILIIGSGPIVIGQGCEFDYSGVQACRALKEEGYRIVLINSNPATIMTDPEFADATYIEPITPEAVEKILAREAASGHPIDSLLPTLGGQTGLNTGMACWDRGILKKYNVKMIGADRDAIMRGEDRQLFKDLMIKIGLKVPRSGVVHTLEEGRKVLEEIGLPLIIRPAFTLGGTGGGIAYNEEEFEEIVTRGLDASPVTEVLIEQSVIGWKEFELEVMRDRNDNVVIICGIENLDPMGVHTGDSITVAPIQTLTDKEYQRMRDAAIAVIRAVGVETGGSNIQFAVNPDNGEMVVVEMNPRVSRSSALASKATGFPIAKIAAKLAVGYTLDELPNDITKKTVACFEPTIDYVVIKIPRWTFEKFPDADETLTTQMKSVGEAMAIGRTFKEALQKGIRSMEVKRFGFGLDSNDKWLRAIRGTGFQPLQGAQHGLQTRATGEWPIPEETLRRKLAVPSQGRLYYIRYALKMGWTIDQIYELTKIDRWFLAQMKELVGFEKDLRSHVHTFELSLSTADERELPRIWEDIRRAKQWGYSDVQLGAAFEISAAKTRSLREAEAIKPAYKLVDTCAAEFEAATPYYYSTYEVPFRVLPSPSGRGQGEWARENRNAPSAAPPHPDPLPEGEGASVEDEIRLTDKPKIIIIGGGPNRIGQGIEFDYCCVHAAFAMKEMGIESVMINSNPETVSTDYDTSDLLFFEPLTHEDILNICERLNGIPFKREPSGSAAGLVKGVIVQFGGQTPLNLARGLQDAGVPIIGTSVDSIERAGDREQFRALLHELGMKQPPNGIARSVEEARKIAVRIGYPVLVRPSFVLGGRAMEIVSDEEQLNYYMAHAVEASTVADAPILVDKFLDAATEVDVDCLADYQAEGTEARRHVGTEGRAIIIGVMEHIEEAGIHSGDSACALPPYSLSKELVEELKRQTRLLAGALRVNGLMNVQFAIRDGEVYVIEVNPRASRTVPFVSKATGVPWAKLAAKVMAGATLDQLKVGEMPDPKHVSVKEVVFPFSKFPGVDVILGPEMRSTGEVMGIDQTFELAFAKASIAAGTVLPTTGTVFISVRDSDKNAAVPIARELLMMGFDLISSGATHTLLAREGIKARRISKLAERTRPNIQDLIKDRKVHLIINTPTKKGPRTDEGRIRAMAVINQVPMVTTITGARATVRAIAALKKGGWNVRPLQAYHSAGRSGSS